MTTLFLDHLTRNETDQATIDVLLRKGWQVQPAPPEHDATTQRVAWSAETQEWVVVDKTPAELAAEARKVWSTVVLFLVRRTMPP